jgi:hypothetical protein
MGWIRLLYRVSAQAVSCSRDKAISSTRLARGAVLLRKTLSRRRSSVDRPAASHSKFDVNARRLSRTRPGGLAARQEIRRDDPQDEQSRSPGAAPGLPDYASVRLSDHPGRKAPRNTNASSPETTSSFFKPLHLSSSSFGYSRICDNVVSERRSRWASSFANRCSVRE